MSVDGADHLPCFHGPVQSGCVWMVQITCPVFMVLYKVDECGWCRSLAPFSWSCTKWMSVDGADHLPCFHGPVQGGCCLPFINTICRLLS